MEALNPFFNVSRGKDVSNFRKVIALIQEFISDIDYELKYIHINLDTNVRKEINTLGFFKCL